MATVDQLLNAEEFSALPDNGVPCELIEGQVVAMNLPNPRHGQICAKIARLLGNFLEAQELGHVVSNDAGIITRRDPDTVRGADVAFYSFDDIPKGPLPQKYMDTPPRLIFEVLSPSDRWNEVIVKVGEYLQAGVRTVAVVVPDELQVHIFHANKPGQILETEDRIEFADLLSGFSITCDQIFE